MRLIKWTQVRHFASLLHSAPPPSAAQPPVVRYTAQPRMHLFPQELSPQERQRRMLLMTQQLKEKLGPANVHGVLKQFPPLLLQALAESPEIHQLSPIQLLSFLHFAARFGYLRTIDTTPALDYLAEVVRDYLHSLAPVEVVLLTSVLSKLAPTKEELFRPVSLRLMEQHASFSPRALANIMSNFTRVATANKTFTAFFEFMKVPLTQLMLSGAIDSRDLLGITRAYSRTYNLTPAFISATENCLVQLGTASRLDPKVLAVVCHSLNLNRTLHNSVRAWDLLESELGTRPEQFSLSEFLLSAKVLRDNGRFGKEIYRRFGERIKSLPSEANLFDVRDAFSLFFWFADAHPDDFYEAEGLRKDRKVLKRFRRPLCECLVTLFGRLSRNLEGPDVVFFLPFVNFAVQLDSEGGRAFVQGLKAGLREVRRRGGLRDSERNAALAAAERVEDQWIRNSLLGKLAD